LNAELQIDAFGGRVGIVEGPVAGLIPAGFRGFAKIMPIYGCIEHLGLSDADVNDPGVTPGSDAQVKSAGFTGDGVFE